MVGHKSIIIMLCVCFVFPGCFQENTSPDSNSRERPSSQNSVDALNHQNVGQGPDSTVISSDQRIPISTLQYDADTSFFGPSSALSEAERLELEAYVLQQQKLADLENYYRFEESRNLQLVAELRTGQLSGCHLRDKVQEIEIVLTGSKEEAQFLSRTSDPDFYTGFDTSLSWKLQFSEAYGFEGERVQSLFGDGKGRIVQSPEGLEVRMLQYVLVERSGFKYEKYEKLERDWILFNKKFYEYYESDRVRLEGVKVVVTNQVGQKYTIYNNTSIGVTLGSNLEIWSEDLRGSAEWGALMARTDCEDTQ
ncbi:MAG: hypothetical protein AB8C84_07550 [Oligoflexales bacterium]